MPAAPKTQIVAIDVLRFACAAMVMAFHYLTVFPLASRGAPAGLALPAGGLAVSWFGWVGVEIFFVISGFVIARSSTGATPAGFVRRRLLRLAPAAWICASVTAIVLLAVGALPPATIGRRWLQALVFWPTGTPIDGVYWTLSVELAFYILIAAALHRIRDIEPVGIVLGLASGGFWLIIAVGRVPIDAIVDGIGWKLTLLPHGAFFGLGMALWSIRERRATPARLLSAAAMAAGGCLEIAINAGRPIGIFGLVTNPLLPVLVFLAAIAFIAGADRFQTPLSRWFGAARLARLGLMTYPLYLLHQTLGAALILGGVVVGLGGYVATMIATLVALLLAWIVTARGEPPIRRMLAAVLTSRHAPAPDIPPNASLPAG